MVQAQATTSIRKRTHYVAVLVDAEPADPVPFDVRLRLALKRMLRWYGLRCVEIRPLPKDTIAEAAA